MSYIARKNARFVTMTGKRLTINKNTRVEEVEEPNVGIVLYLKDTPLCARDSETARAYFAYDGDGNGVLRGKLLDSILDALEMKPGRDVEERQVKWDKLWGSPQANAYRRKDYDDFWVWDESFFRAPVIMLQYIAGLIGV